MGRFEKQLKGRVNESYKTEVDERKQVMQSLIKEIDNVSRKKSALLSNSECLQKQRETLRAVF
jgi:FtsZ-binding cell division protein ZapB